MHVRTLEEYSRPNITDVKAILQRYGIDDDDSNDVALAAAVSIYFDVIFGCHRPQIIGERNRPPKCSGTDSLLTDSPHSTATRKESEKTAREPVPHTLLLNFQPILIASEIK